MAQVARFAYALLRPRWVMYTVKVPVASMQLALSGRRHKPYRLRADGWRDRSDFLRIPTEFDLAQARTANGMEVAEWIG